MARCKGQSAKTKGFKMSTLAITEYLAKCGYNSGTDFATETVVVYDPCFTFDGKTVFDYVEIQNMQQAIKFVTSRN